jgi:L-asparaginase
MENTNPQSKVLLISTGGTIEKTYNESDGSLENKSSVIMQKICNNIRIPYTDLDVEVILSKDSLYMDENDRKDICSYIEDRSSEGLPIVILHGTDTMELTANYCFEKIKNPKVPFIFTGAMMPLEFEKTDAVQNVTEALFAAKIIDPGFYISFHNRLYQLPKVRKNRKQGTFESY